MESKTYLPAKSLSQSKSPSKTQHWFEELGLIARFPRTPYDDILKRMERIQEPQIFLQPGENTTDIIIRLPVSSRIVPVDMQQQFDRYATLLRAFEDVLWEKHGSRRNGTWGEFSGLATAAYREALLQWFRLHYLGHFHPAADAAFQKMEKDLMTAAKSTRLGRRPAIQAELTSIKTRYRDLLPRCQFVHDAAKRAAATVKAHNLDTLRKERRLAIWNEVKNQLHGIPEDGYIFSGRAFGKIPSGTAKLHEYTSWKPHQLAISIIAFERKQAYQTIQKKIGPKNFSL